MGLFDKLKEPVFLKDDSDAERQLAALRELREQAPGELADKIDEEINRVNAGIWGEQTVRFELENSHLPMYILHDLFLEYDGLTAQIDYLIVTRKQTFVIECKNLYGDIEIKPKNSASRPSWQNSPLSAPVRRCVRLWRRAKGKTPPRALRPELRRFRGRPSPPKKVQR